MNDVRHVAYCPHCGNRAPQLLRFTHDYAGDGYRDDGTLDEGAIPGTYFLAECETCHDLLLYHAMGWEQNNNYFPIADLMYPKGPDLGKQVPESVRACYLEASLVKNNAPNAYAVMIRRALEAICDDRDVKGRNLAKRLSVLAERGEIPGRLSEMTTVLRTVGNAGAHRSELSVTPPMTWAMDQFFRTIVEYVYIAPGRLKEFTVRLQKLNKQDAKK
jgi:hypothetical protein